MNGLEKALAKLIYSISFIADDQQFDVEFARSCLPDPNWKNALQFIMICQSQTKLLPPSLLVGSFRQLFFGEKQ